MGAPKAALRGTPLFYRVDPSELDSMDEWAEWLDCIRTSPFVQIREIDGEPQLVEIRGVVARIPRGIIVEVRSNEHPPPHFHVRAQAMDASFAIDDCAHLHGEVGPADLRVIKYWHKRARRVLMDAWNASRPDNCSVGVFPST